MLRHDLFAPVIVTTDHIDLSFSTLTSFWQILLPFTMQEGLTIPQHWTGGWNSIIAWPGNRDLSRDQWELLSQTFRVFYYFAHERQETLATWPSFLRAYLLAGEVGACFGEVVATCGEMQLVLLIAWVNSRLPVRPSMSLHCQFRS